MVQCVAAPNAVALMPTPGADCACFSPTMCRAAPSQPAEYARLYTNPSIYAVVDKGGQGTVMRYLGSNPSFRNEAVKVSLLRSHGMVDQAHKEMMIGSLRIHCLVAPSCTAVSCDPCLVSLVGGQPGADAVLVQNMEFIGGGTLESALLKVRGLKTTGRRPLHSSCQKHTCPTQICNAPTACCH